MVYTKYLTIGIRDFVPHSKVWWNGGMEIGLKEYLCNAIDILWKD